MRPALLLGLLLGPGCSAMTGLGLGPTVTTDGVPGFEAHLVFGFGGGGGNGGATVNAVIGGGFSGRAEEGLLNGGMELSGFIVDDDSLGARLGLVYTARRRYPEDGTVASHGVGANVGLYGEISNTGGDAEWGTPFGNISGGHRGEWLMLGLQAQFDWVWGEGGDYGIASFPLVLEGWWTAELPRWF